MNKDDIIRMAREAGMKLAWIATLPGSDKMKVLLDTDQVERFAALVVAAEREACAKLCDELAARDKLSNYYAIAAKAIRARGKE